jgi:hypothetical protein
MNACLDPPPVVLPIARVELPAAGCSVGFGSWPWLLMFWCLRRMKKS